MDATPLTRERPVRVTPSLQSAYAVCRNIARREAKNFYYAFVALPAQKRNAMCAFMRRADDISDDESRTAADRRRELDAWLASWKQALRSGASDDPVFAAVADTCKRFSVPDELLDQLVAGTAMDLDAALARSPACGHTLGRDSEGPVAGASGLEAFETYSTFADLYRYCYYVASVVGLVCIRIFGYHGSPDDRRAAEKLAEETGIAFQLTNILRDVREDAARRRIYLPLDDLRRHSVTPEDLAGLRSGAQLRPNHRALLAETAERARGYYKAARRLLPLVDSESRPAVWVLVTIYARLLRRIEAADYDVFSARVRVPTWQKLAILAAGLARMGVARLLPRLKAV
jgi:phytoene synthase